MRVLRLLIVAMVLTCVADTQAPAQGWFKKKGSDAAKTEEADKKAEKEKELTLERLFPEKSFFGPSASGIAFSHDGRYAAYLYRPYIERRHGSDLWIYDFETHEATRITSATVMSEFQASTRKVRKDRIEKAKKRGDDKKKQKKANAGDETPDDGVSGDWEGRLNGDHELIPPDGLAFTFAIRVSKDGSVSGTIVTSLSTVSITEGTFDRESGLLECAFSDVENGLSGTLRATVADGVMEGTLTVAEMELDLELRAERTDADDSDADAGNESETGVVEEDAKKTDGDLGDLVGEKDADDDKAPRYAGVGPFTWAPHEDELIFAAGGDLYQLTVSDGAIVRLTRTEERERGVQYLPDGSGYTYMRGAALIKVSFDDHFMVQLDPRLGDGERMSDYRLSPDSKRLVILASKGESMWTKGRKVSIVNYRSRFAAVREVTRHMPDDPIPEFVWSVYLYDLSDHMTEKGEPKKVYTHKQSGPRDIMRVPEWAPDSSRVAFAVYEQTSGHVEILEARFVPRESDEENEKKKEESSGAEVTKDEDGADDARADGLEEDEPPFKIEDARSVYRFLHNGGPTTPSMIHPYYLDDSKRLVFMTELSGFRHLHVLDPVYERLDQLTRGHYEVYPIEIAEDHKRLFALANKGDLTQQHVFAVDLETGDLSQLSHRTGYYSGAAVSLDGSRALALFADFGSPRELVAIDTDPSRAEEAEQVLTDSHPAEAKELTKVKPEYFTYENRHGHEIHGHMFRPDGWTADDKRPLLIYVYGGPLGTRKMTSRGDFSGAGYFFAWYMAKKHGYVTCTIDPRGVSGYGGLFEKSNFEQVGRPQVEDLVDATKWFVENQGVDSARIGLHGWSFGGFQTQMCLYTEPEVFACGIAGAGPTEWENYNSWYSTGTIGPSRAGKTDLDKFSLLPLAKNLKAKLLLVHGMEDSNVLYQDTVRVYRELLKAGKEALVDLFLDPTGGHGLGGDVKSLNRYRKYEEFLTRVLGSEAPEKDDDEDEKADDAENAGDEAAADDKAD